MALATNRLVKIIVFIICLIILNASAEKTNKDEVLFAIIELKDGSKHRVELGQTQSFFNKHRKDFRSYALTETLLYDR